MRKSGKHKRLDRVEVGLTPKEWAIRLVDEQRSYCSEVAFFKAVAKGTYREAPFVKPFYALAQQAKEHHRASTQVQARHQLNRKLRTEFHRLQLLITDVDENIRDKVEMNRLRISALAVRLRELLLRHASECISERAVKWIGGCKAVDVDEPEERQLILKEFADFGLAVDLRACPPSLVQDLQTNDYPYGGGWYKRQSGWLSGNISTAIRSLAERSNRAGSNDPANSGCGRHIQ